MNVKPDTYNFQDVQSEAEVDDVRVVAVDSRRERRHVIRRLLEHCFEPAEIGEADSREAAIEVVGRCRPDVVVLEIAMPVAEGLDTITALRLMTPPPRIVVYSFRHDTVTVQAALARGADAYVTKPAGSAELRAALGVPLAARAVRHRPPNERPVSPSPLRNPGPAIATGATT
ncbi:MAG TPA: response regulator transcription factor [Acidimicrobiia bacterium]|nr:response regulator transcription factor [Acidimicrobiia bacterium]